MKRSNVYQYKVIEAYRYATTSYIHQLFESFKILRDGFSLSGVTEVFLISEQPDIQQYLETGVRCC